MNNTRKRSKNFQSAFHAAEAMSHDLALQRGKKTPVFEQSGVEGLLSSKDIAAQIKLLKKLDVDGYIQRVITPSESQKRPSSPEIIRQLGAKIIFEESEGPLYMAEGEFEIGGLTRRLGFIAQNHKSQNGVWYPKHHRKAAEMVRFYASHAMPLVTFMDTPGAAADAEANLQNQSHSISFFISEMANLQLPVVGVVFGGGYSGGAIPLATANLLLSVREGVFNTIHPKGLSNIARKYNLSWQESAKYIGVSAYELQSRGYFDGVIDYSYDQPHQIKNLTRAIITGIESVEMDAVRFLKEHDFFFQHYRDSIQHYLDPSELLIESNRRTDRPPTGTLNIFGDVYRFMRFLRMRQRISSRTVYQYSRLSPRKTPVGRLQQRREEERRENFKRWVSSTLEIRYNETLFKRYEAFLSSREVRDKERNKFTRFFMGDPRENFLKSIEDLVTEILIYLYNHWKDNAAENLIELFEYLQRSEIHELPPGNPVLLDLLQNPEIQPVFIENYQNIILFDLLYNQLIDSLPTIAGEVKGNNRISRESVENLFDVAFEGALKEFEKSSLSFESEWLRDHFFKWLVRFIERKDCDEVMGTISTWKRVVFPRMSPPLFGVVRYFFSGLLPSLYDEQQGKGRFDGKITPRNIGIKDFWNRLDQAYKDLLIQNLLRESKKKTISPKMVIEQFFTGFQELYGERITSNPLQFPGFRDAIERALSSGVVPCGVITGLAHFEIPKEALNQGKNLSLNGSESDSASNDATNRSNLRYRVGLVISNNEFQAGAFDMASCDKVCRLLDECAQMKLPVIMFISSAGMQTKEGAGSLFSMSIINDRLTRFIKDFDLPVICFGFRDCTGGAQASFMTHLLVRTYYLSGTQMPFAGQLVVESHLPAHATLANYLSANNESMDGLVANPFDENLDERLKEIDPQIPTAQHQVKDVIARILAGEYQLSIQDHAPRFSRSDKIRPKSIKRVLIHARGCTAARLVQGAQQAGLQAVLVASDPDMESKPVKQLGEDDRLVCIGGNTPQESYLNAMSVIRVAEQEEVDAIHPGIGFLSESPRYARICREHGFNFVGPRADNMDRMGNKSNAIATAKNLNIPVVPGSEGALTDPSHAASVAQEIGFPVLIKAAHGGGGKGIGVVEDPDWFPSTFSRMSQEALSAFGNGDLYLEKYITSMRHLEVQVLRDTKGNSKLLGIRDCSVQRDYQKLIEESVFNIPKKTQQILFDHALKLINHIDYVGAGTVEFIYDLKEKKVYFMEMNTRLQVEHPVTEMVSQVNLVQQQFEIAQGKNIAQLPVRFDGHAIEVRVNAERVEVQDNGSLNFVPEPGYVGEVHFPDETHVRVISAVEEGSLVPPYYDSMIAQIICWGSSRKEACSRMLDYLGKVRLEGISTNLALSRMILSDAEFLKGRFDTGFLKGFLERIDFNELKSRIEHDSGDSGKGLSQEELLVPETNEIKVISPQMGGFYLSPSPEEDPFVREGQVIDIEQPICLLESMKVFSEINLAHFKSDDGQLLYPQNQHYRVTRVIAEDRQTVNEGDLLFIVETVDKSIALSN